MSSQPHSSIAPVVSLELSIYQNRQLSRLVRKMRKDASIYKSAPRHVDGETEKDGSRNVDVIDAIIEDLKAENRSLAFRLDRCLAALSVHRAKDVGNVEYVSIKPPLDFESCTSLKQADIDGLHAEIVSLKTSVSMIRETRIPDETVGFRGNLSTFHKSWKLDCTGYSSGPPTELDTFLAKMQETLRITEQTFLTQIETMSEDLALKQQECRKLAARVAELEESLKNSLNAVSIISPVTTAAGEVTEHDRVRTMEKAYSLLQGQMRVKEEQCSRILSQHVQLQHRSSILAQDVERLRDACASHLELQSASKSTLGSIYLRETSEAGIRAAYIEQSKRELILRGRIQEVLATATRRLASYEHMDLRVNKAFDKLQGDLGECLRQKSEILRSKQDYSSQRQISSTGSLAQIELDDLKSKIRCSLCLLRNKAVALGPCLHCFCRECVDEKMLGARNRKCPLCMHRFSDAEVREIHFLKD